MISALPLEALLVAADVDAKEERKTDRQTKAIPAQLLV
eukprot:COSAG06_NODE_1420_length_9514_cov_3.400106_5_plen_38_part_00